MKNFKTIATCLLSILILNTSPAKAQEVSVEPVSHFAWTQFELGANVAFQSGGFSTYSGIVRWTPEFRVNQAWAFGLDLGFTDFKYSDTTHSAVIEYAATARYRMGDWSVKGLVGAQSWTSGQYHTYFLIGPEVMYQFDQRVLHFIDHVFVSYTPVLRSGSTINEFAAGIGLTF